MGISWISKCIHIVIRCVGIVSGFVSTVRKNINIVMRCIATINKCISTINRRRKENDVESIQLKGLWMQNNWKMKSKSFIHNDDVKCFHKGHKKVIMMGCNYFEDEALIKRWWKCQKINGMGRKFKDKNKLSNYQKLFSFALGSCVCFQNFRVHMENAIEIF
jgi:hypothetical protein